MFPEELHWKVGHRGEDRGQSKARGDSRQGFRPPWTGRCHTCAGGPGGPPLTQCLVELELDEK